MVTFEVESNRLLTAKDGASYPFLKVLFGNVIDVKMLNPKTGAEIEPVEGDRRVFIADPHDRYRLKFEAAPNFVWNMVLREQQYRDDTSDPDDEKFVSIVTASAYLLDDETLEPTHQLEIGQFLPE